MDLNFLFSDSQEWNIEEGCYVKKSSQKVLTSYSSEMQNDYFGIEDSSWWFQYRSEVVNKIVDKVLDSPAFIIDIGGGNGYTTKKLQDSGYEVMLMEPATQACLNAKKRGLQNVICGTINQNDFNDNSIAACCMLDVLEHIENDIEFLQMVKRKLTTKGYLLITVPAFTSLWSSEDEAVGHYRRYTKKEIQSLLEKLGYKIVYANYFFNFLYIPIFFVRRLGEKIGLMKKYQKRNESEKNNVLKQQHTEQKKITKFVLNLFEKVELRRLLRNKKIRFGSSVIIVAQKNEK